MARLDGVIRLCLLGMSGQRVAVGDIRGLMCALLEFNRYLLCGLTRVTVIFSPLHCLMRCKRTVRLMCTLRLSVWWWYVGRQTQSGTDQQAPAQQRRHQWRGEPGAGAWVGDAVHDTGLLSGALNPWCSAARGAATTIAVFFDLGQDHDCPPFRHCVIKPAISRICGRQTSCPMGWLCHEGSRPISRNCTAARSPSIMGTMGSALP